MKIQEEYTVPYFQGSAIRGVLGRNLRKISCIMNDNIECIDCKYNNSCSYTNAFYGINNDKDTILSNVDKIPNPYVIYSPLQKKQVLGRDDCYSFYISIFGRGLSYITQYLFSIIEFNKMQLFKNKENSAVLESIKDAEKDIIIYENGKLLTDKIQYSTFDISKININANSMKVTFNTPIRIKKSGKFIQNIDFEDFVKNILRRIALMEEYYSEDALKDEHIELLKKAKEIKTKSINMRWKKLNRFSTNQEKIISLGGSIGDIIFEGDLKEFIPFIEYGKLLHIGKGCTMGLGNYSTKYFL